MTMIDIEGSPSIQELYRIPQYRSSQISQLQYFYETPHLQDFICSFLSSQKRDLNRKKMEPFPQ